MIQHISTNIVADGAGAATVYLGSKLRGHLLALIYRPGTLATGADLVITLETAGSPVLTVTNAGTSDVTYYPRAPANQVADAANITYSAEKVPMYFDRIKVVVAQGGAAGAGSIEAIWETGYP